MPSGKSWKNILENYAFFIGSNGKQAEIVNVPVCVDFYFYLFLKTTTVNILLRATVSVMDYTPNVVSKRVFCLYLSIPGLRKGPGKFLTRVLEKSWIFSRERVGTLLQSDDLSVIIAETLPLCKSSFYTCTSQNSVPYGLGE